MDDLKELQKKKGQRLKQLIKSHKGLTQKKLACEVLYMTEANLTNIIKGKTDLTVPNAQILANFFHVRIEYLLCMDDYKTDTERFDSGFKVWQQNRKKLHDTHDGILQIASLKGYTFEQVKQYHNDVDSTGEQTYKEKYILHSPDNQTGVDCKVSRMNEFLDDINAYIDLKLALLKKNIEDDNSIPF